MCHDVSVSYNNLDNNDTLTKISSAGAILSFLLGFVAVASSSTTATENSASITNPTTQQLSSKGGGNGSGGGCGAPGDNSSPVSVIATAQNASKMAAEDDVRKVEEEAERNPYPVS